MGQVKTKIEPIKLKIPIFKPLGALRVTGRPDNEKHFAVFHKNARTPPSLKILIE